MAKKGQKTVERQAEYTYSGVPGLLSGTNRYNAFWTNGRAHAVRFLLHFSMYLFSAPNGPGIPVFGRRP